MPVHGLTTRLGELDKPGWWAHGDRRAPQHVLGARLAPCWPKGPSWTPKAGLHSLLFMRRGQPRSAYPPWPGQSGRWGLLCSISVGQPMPPASLGWRPACFESEEAVSCREPRCPAWKQASLGRPVTCHGSLPGGAYAWPSPGLAVALVPWSQAVSP